MGANSRTKGKRGELEVASMIEAKLGVPMQRNLRQARDAGRADLVVADSAPKNGLTQYLDGLSIEVKHYARYRLGDIAGWWCEAVDESIEEGKAPCLWYRGAREPWRIVMPISAVATRELDFTATLFVPGWAMMVRGRGQ